jgi:hydroxyacylglutathione hydrolase
MLDTTTPITPTALQIECIPAFQDNYLWLIHDGCHAVAVDPGDSAPILAALKHLHLQLTAILITHHHNDHCGGVTKLLQHTSVPVYGPAKESIAGVSIALDEGARVALQAPALQLQVIAVPGHTLGHIAYHASEQGWLFCGDTLFAGGCGRLFEGSPDQMQDSLARLAALPEATQVFCAHEYTLSNLKFAQAVDHDNPALEARITFEQAKRKANLPTVPSTIAVEKASNPFLRCDQTAIIQHLRQAGRLNNGEGPVQVFAAMREWKNEFR